jgi:hypothetical protein
MCHYETATHGVKNQKCEQTNSGNGMTCFCFSRVRSSLLNVHLFIR